MTSILSSSMFLVLVIAFEIGCHQTMSLEILLEAALFVERQNQGEDPNGQTDQILGGEISRVGSKLGDQTSSSTVSNGGSGGERREDYSIDQSHVASVIQRLGQSSTKASSLRHAAASFYSYQQDRSRSPSPARGSGSHYSDVVAAAAAASQHHRSAAPSPTHSHSHSLHHHLHHQQQQPHLSSLANGNYATAFAHQRSYQSSSPNKMMMDVDSSPYSQQLHQQLHGGGHGSLTSTTAATSSSSSSSSSTSSNSNHHHSSSMYRVDDLASRSHRLEEALLRASRKSPPMPSSTSSSQQSQNAGGNHSGRTSADELLELKKRSGAGTREVHNKLEKNRRAHLRECFEFLRKQLPAIDDKKLSNLGILKSALRFIQTLKRKEREYEHTMERLAREKIASQQRLAALRKEVSSIPGYTGDIVPMGNVSLPGVLHSQHIQQQQMIQERDSPLTFANVQAHTLREENHHHYHMQPGSGTPIAAAVSAMAAAGGNRNHECDQDSNSGTSTASEGEGGDASEHDEREEPSRFTQTFSSKSQQHVVVRPVAQQQAQPLSGLVVVNGTNVRTPTAVALKRPIRDEHDDVVTQMTSEGDVMMDNSRPHIKYVRASITNPTTTTVTTLANVAVSQPTAYLTLPMVPAASGGVIELAPVGESGRDGGALYHVRHPSTIAFATSATGHHVQLTGSQVLATHHGVQLLTTHGSSTLKVLTAAPSAALTGTSVRVISTDGVSTSLQPLVAVHAAASVAGAKCSDESSALLNGKGTAALTAPTGTGFCIPTGVMIPVALSATEAVSTSSSSPAAASATSSSYELQRNAVNANAMANNVKNSSVNSPAVLSLSNGLLKATVNRGSLQPSTMTGVMTPLAVPRPLVTSMAVVGTQPTKHAVAHILTNSSLDKVGPLLKSASIPIIGGQFNLGSPAGRHVRPVMVMTAPLPSTSPSTAATPRDTIIGAAAPSSRPNTPQSKFPST